MAAESGVVAVLASVGAFGVGLVASARAVHAREKSRAAARRRASLSGEGLAGSRGGRGISDGVVSFVEARSRVAKKRSARPVSPRREETLAQVIRQAGLASSASIAGFLDARLRLAIFAAAAGALLGCALSFELAVLLAVAGGLWGFSAPKRALEKRKKDRAEELERHLPEMLEVISLGLRSGLSFDRSLDVYFGHFNTLLSRSLASARQQWALGLARRDDALRSVAETYDSALFSRAIESVIRSLRYGSSLAEGLEATAREARASYRALKQERVAKAPVKMMVPTGTLMLPAMLILVLGPMLLELVGGF